MTKEIKIEFAPGAFDSFEGTQEELDALQKEIMDMFQNKTSEEILAMSQPLDLDQLDDLPDDVLEQLARSFNDDPATTRKLQ